MAEGREPIRVAPTDPEAASLWSAFGELPTLLGALLIKARSILVHADPATQHADLVLLLSLIEDPSATAEQLRGRERSWLRKCEAQLGLDDPILMASFPPMRVRRARLAYRLLVA